MKRSLQGKLILSFLAVALLTVLVVSALIRLTSGQSLMNLVADQQTAELKAVAQTYYAANGTMEGFFDYYLQGETDRPKPDQPGSPDQPQPDVRGFNGMVDSEFRTLIPSFGYDIGDLVPADQLKNALPVEVDGQTVAWILPDTKKQFKLSAEEELFLERTNMAIGLAALAAVLAAVAMGFILSRGLVKPIRRLTKASKALAAGDLQQQVPVTSQDELGHLTATFNQMSTDLYQADQQRKRMTADITHDLSTPLQIISGYVEMLENEEVTLTPQRIEIIKTEIDHLRRLVGDLTTLSQVEAGGLEIQLNPVQPRLLLERTVQAYQPIAARQGIELRLDISTGLPAIRVDEGRMQQVLKNLVENALRYTPKNGVIQLGAMEDDGKVQISVRDSGAGIEPDDLPYVFDRFYRADKARGGNAGKMGLGLAICKALVTAMGGKIAAQSAGKGQGAVMILTFDAVADA